MKNYLLLTFLCVNGFNLKAIDFNFWGLDISKSHVEISGCLVEELKDNTIFSKVKITADTYTFANERPVYSCYYGDEIACFSKATEIIGSKFGNPLEVYTYNENNPFSTKASFFNIWKYNQDDQHYVLLLFGSGEGMTLDVIHFVSEKRLRQYILSTINSFHFSIKPELNRYLDK